MVMLARKKTRDIPVAHVFAVFAKEPRIYVAITDLNTAPSSGRRNNE
jgi:hypothetical protein